MFGPYEITRWLAAFAFTEVVEVPIYAVLARGAFPSATTRWFRFVVAFGASALTHPIVSFVIPRLLSDWTTMLVVSEVFAVLVEAAWLRAFGVRRALAWSAFANLASVAFGSALRIAIGFP